MSGRRPAAPPDTLADLPGAGGPGRVLRETPGVAQGVLADLDVRPPGQGLGQAQQGLRESSPEGPRGVEVLVEQRCQVGVGQGTPLEAHHRRTLALPVQIDEGPLGGLCPGLLEALALAQPMEHRLHVLAGAELVGGEVGAGAVIGPAG